MQLLQLQLLVVVVVVCAAAAAACGVVQLLQLQLLLVVVVALVVAAAPVAPAAVAAAAAAVVVVVVVVVVVLVLVAAAAGVEAVAAVQLQQLQIQMAAVVVLVLVAAVVICGSGLRLHCCRRPDYKEASLGLLASPTRSNEWQNAMQEEIDTITRKGTFLLHLFEEFLRWSHPQYQTSSIWLHLHHLLKMLQHPHLLRNRLVRSQQLHNCATLMLKRRLQRNHPAQSAAAAAAWMHVSGSQHFDVPTFVKLTASFLAQIF